MEEAPIYPFPKQVLFIVVFELFTGCGGYAITSLMVIYFMNGLKMEEDQALVIFHTYISIRGVFPLLGAIVADSFFGKYKTLILGLIIYDLGLIFLLMGSIQYLELSPLLVTIVGLSLLSIGSGICLPCVAALGGDQFKLPEQGEQMSKYFKLFYWAINMGSLIGVIVVPMMRTVKCFGRNSCYPLAFGVSIILLIIGHISIAVGGPFYIIKKPQQNVVVDVSACIGYAIHRKIKSKDKKDHWLDYAADKFDEKLISDIKIVLDVMVIFIVLPVYWCLQYQQSSDWALLASKLDGDIGFYTILPEQTQILSKVSIVILIPVFDSTIEPVLKKFHFCVTPLKRMALGFLLTGIAFITSGTIYFCVYKDLPVPPAEGSIQIRVFNPKSEPVGVIVKGIERFSNITLKAFDYQEFLQVKFTESKHVWFNDVKILVDQEQCYTLICFDDKLEVFQDKIEKPEKDQFPRVRTIMASRPELHYKSIKGKGNDFIINSGSQDFQKIDSGVYKIIKNGQKFPKSIKFKAGGVYVVMIDPQFKEVKRIILVKENRISIFWIIPQFIILAMADILVAITMIEFAYSQAPASLKTFLQAIKALTTAMGNFLVVVVTEISVAHRGYNAFIYTILIYLNMLALMFISRKYKYKTAEQLTD